MQSVQDGMHVLPPVPTDKLTIETSSEFRPKHTGEVPKETYALVTKGMTNGFCGGGSVDRKEKINLVRKLCTNLQVRTRLMTLE